MSAEPDPFLPDFDLGEAIDAGFEAPTLEAFHHSAFYREHATAFERWAGSIRSGAGTLTPAPAGKTIRLLHWNIEQGRQWERILAAIGSDPRLAAADIWTCNEVDVGTVRVGNRDIVSALAARLGFHWIYAANYVELTCGPGSGLRGSGRNRVGLHGQAILSRWPLSQPAAARLPECFDYFGFSEEKRIGGRRILWATVEHPHGPVRIATTHLEVRNRPACRARQMEAALAALPAGPCWLTGDWNSHTFHRGTLRRSIREFLRLQTSSPGEIARQLLAPWEREPLFALVERAGFDFRSFNDELPTALQRLSGVEEIERLPASLRGPARRLFRLQGRTLKMRLDWIAVRGSWRPAGSRAAWTGTAHGPEGTAASDHAPVGVEAIRTATPV